MYTVYSSSAASEVNDIITILCILEVFQILLKVHVHVQ